LERFVPPLELNHSTLLRPRLALESLEDLCRTFANLALKISLLFLGLFQIVRDTHGREQHQCLCAHATAALRLGHFFLDVGRKVPHVLWLGVRANGKLVSGDGHSY
jgi:hypothetical protein